MHGGLKPITEAIIVDCLKWKWVSLHDILMLSFFKLVLLSFVRGSEVNTVSWVHWTTHTHKEFGFPALPQSSIADSTCWEFSSDSHENGFCNGRSSPVHLPLPSGFRSKTSHCADCGWRLGNNELKCASYSPWPISPELMLFLFSTGLERCWFPRFKPDPDPEHWLVGLERPRPQQLLCQPHLHPKQERPPYWQTSHTYRWLSLAPVLLLFVTSSSWTVSDWNGLVLVAKTTFMAWYQSLHFSAFTRRKYLFLYDFLMKLEVFIH